MNIIDRPSKYSKEYLKKLFQYSLGEDIANAVTHTVGSFFGLYALITLSWISGHYGNWLDSFAFIFYGLTLLIMFLMSTLYHSMINHTARSVFKKLDHISIYVLILGTYTPYIFSLLKTRSAYTVYLILITMTVLGIIFKTFYAGRFRYFSTITYLIMGWSAIGLLPQIVHKINIYGLYFLLFGGAMYSIGAIIYAFAKFKYSHMVWHIFVIFGALFHYISITFFILQYR